MKLFRLLILIAIACNVSVYAQKKAARRNSKSRSAPQESELTKLRDQYISATKEYKASLQKLVTLYEDSVKKAEQRHEKSEKLFAEGLISKRDVEESERLLVDAKLKVTTTQQQIDGFLAAPKGPAAATLLDSASTRIVYDVTGYWREPDPAKKPPAI